MGIKKLFQEKGLISGKRTLAAILVLTMTIGTTLFVSASSHTYKSTGNVEYQDSTGTKTTLFAVEDIDYLDSKIDAVEADVIQGKGVLADKLNGLGTNTGLSSSSTFDELGTGIDNSQTVPDITVSDALTSAGFTSADIIEANTNSGGSVTGSENLKPITAENVSLGSAGYVDGELIVGNGGDNNNYYLLGHTIQKTLVGSWTTTESNRPTSYTFNCTSINGWENFTSDNFGFITTGGWMNTKGSNEQRQVVTRELNISYNQSTGIVTVSNYSMGYSLYSDVFGSIMLSGKVYCYH